MAYTMFGLHVLQNAAAATGNGTVLECEGYNTVVLQILGTFVGTVTFEGTLDGTNFVAIQAVNMADGSLATTATTVGLYTLSISGLKQLRARVSAWTSGTITVNGSRKTGGYIIHD